MNRLFKFWLLCVLAVAIPLQGLAAGMTPSCGAGIHHGAPPAMTSPHAAHGDESAVSHRHATAYVGSEATSASTKTSLVHSAHPALDTHGTCSACAACCIGAALPLAALEWPVDVHDNDVPTLRSVSGFVGHISGVLERSPRLSLV